ncbi:MAG: hypothetical protein NTV68_06270 [Methanomicrobiales archaeon]|nr:hypothetical protein [Methanomicrobiales archaeon]
MTRRSIRIATTHAFPDYPCVTLDDLKRHLATIGHVIIPVYAVHDPRQPPIGRVVSGVIVALEDGEYALDAGIELFGPDFVPEGGTSVDRRVALLNKPRGKFGIWCDMRSITPEKTGALREIGEILGTHICSGSGNGILQEEPFILTIGIGTLPFGYIAGTLSRRLTAEKIHLLTGTLTRMYTAPGEDQPDSLLIFDLDVPDRQQRSLLIEVVLTNPSGKDIESFFSGGFDELDRILPPFYLSRLHPKKIVLSYRDGRFRVLYAIQEQGIPMIPRSDSFHG